MALSVLAAGPVVAGGIWAGRDDVGQERFAPATGGALSIRVDMARVVSFARPAATVIVGNDDIMEATLIDNRTVALTGRRPGRTNMLVLDEDRRPIFDRDIEVVGVVPEQPRVITVRRGGSLEILVCSAGGNCPGLASEGNREIEPDDTLATPQADGS